MFIWWKCSTVPRFSAFSYSLQLPCFYVFGLNPTPIFRRQVDNFATLSYKADQVQNFLPLVQRIFWTVVSTSTWIWAPTLVSRSENSTSPISSQTPLSCQSSTSSLVKKGKGCEVCQPEIFAIMFQGPNNNLRGRFWTKHNPQQSLASLGGAISSLWMEGWLNFSIMKLSSFEAGFPQHFAKIYF